MVGTGPTATIIELLGQPKGCPIKYTCADGINISKGELLRLIDPRTVTAGKLLSVTTVSQAPFAGIAAMDKLASDGSTAISVWTKGVFDIKISGANAIPKAGQWVGLSGGNILSWPAGVLDATPISESFSGGYFVGRALETASAQETIAVAIGIY